MTVFIKRIRIGGGLAKATVEILNWWFHKGEKGYPSLAATSCLMSLNPFFRQDFHCSPDDVGFNSKTINNYAAFQLVQQKPIQDP